MDDRLDARSIGTTQVRAAVIEWDVGINDPDGPGHLVETILPARYGGRDVWRVVHRDADPAEDGTYNAYDLYDVDRDTLVPRRSAMSREGLLLRLDFDADRVTIDSRTGDERALTEVAVTEPMPEGPGLQVLLGALPLRDGYRTTFEIVDRWDTAQRIKQLDLSAAGNDPITTPLGRCEVLEVVLAPRDDSFRIRQWTRAAPPHYPLRTEYRRGDMIMVSEVTRMVIDNAEAAWSRGGSGLRP